MARQKGSKTSVRIYEQTDLMTVAAGGSNGLLLPYISTDVRRTQGLVESRVLTGNRNSQEPVLGDKDVNGSIVIQPETRAFGYILKHLFGAVSVGAAVGGVYPHTFTIGDLPAGLTVEKWLPQIPAALQTFGCKINGMRLDVGPSGLLEATLEIMGVDEVDPAPVAPIDVTPLAYPFTALRLPTVTLSEGGTPMLTATRFSMELRNNIDGLRVVGNLGRYGDLSEGIFTATGTMSVLFDDMVMYNKAKAQTSSALVITFPSSTTPAGQDVQFLFDEVKYDISSPGVAGPGGMVVDFNWRAFVGTGTSTARALLHSDVASFASIT